MLTGFSNRPTERLKETLLSRDHTYKAQDLWSKHADAATSAATTIERPPDGEISIHLNGTPSRSWVQPLLTSLTELANLPANWNGYGEKRIHPSSIKRVAAILDAMGYDGPAPVVVPLASGDLQIEFRLPGADLEIKVPAHGSAQAWLFNDDGDESNWAVSHAFGLRRLSGLLQAPAHE